MEKLKLIDTTNYVMNSLGLEPKAYRASYARYAMNISKSMQIKDARRLVQLEIEARHMGDIDFNEEMVDVPRVKKIIKFYEAAKLEVLKELSNPFVFRDTEKESFVLKLATE